MCFFRGNHFTTDQYSGTHLEFIDAESASVFDDVRSMLLAIPLNQTRSETCRLTVWERTDLSNFTPGFVYEIRHVFDLNLYNKMLQGSATRVCTEGRVEVEQPRAGNDATPPENAVALPAQTDNAATAAAAATANAGDAAEIDVRTATTIPVAILDPVDLAASATPKRKHADGSPQKETSKPPAQKKQRTVKLVNYAAPRARSNEK